MGIKKSSVFPFLKPCSDRLCHVVSWFLVGEKNNEKLISLCFPIPPSWVCSGCYDVNNTEEEMRDYLFSVKYFLWKGSLSDYPSWVVWELLVNHSLPFFYIFPLHLCPISLGDAQLNFELKVLTNAALIMLSLFQNWNNCHAGFSRSISVILLFSLFGQNWFICGR